MAAYGTSTPGAIKSPEYNLARRCKTQSGSCYNLCRFRLSKIEINQKGFYSAGSYGGPCRHADLFHFAFQVCRVCRNTSGDLPRTVSPRCPLTWRFDLFRSWRCSLEYPFKNQHQMKHCLLDWALGIAHHAECSVVFVSLVELVLLV